MTAETNPDTSQSTLDRAGRQRRCDDRVSRMDGINFLAFLPQLLLPGTFSELEGSHTCTPAPAFITSHASMHALTPALVSLLLPVNCLGPFAPLPSALWKPQHISALSGLFDPLVTPSISDTFGLSTMRN